MVNATSIHHMASASRTKLRSISRSETPLARVPLTKRRHCNEDGEIDQGRKAHGQGAEEQRLTLVLEHHRQNAGPDQVARRRHQDKGDEEQDVEHVEHCAHSLEHDVGVRHLVKENGADAGAHVDREPTARSSESCRMAARSRTRA